MSRNWTMLFGVWSNFCQNFIFLKFKLKNYAAITDLQSQYPPVVAKPKTKIKQILAYIVPSKKYLSHINSVTHQASKLVYATWNPCAHIDCTSSKSHVQLRSSRRRHECNTALRQQTARSRGEARQC